VAGGLTPHGSTPSNLEYALSLLKEEAILLNKLPGWTSSLAARTDLLKSTKEMVSEPFAALTVLAETTRDLRQRREDVQGAAQQLTSALRSPNVKGQWGEVNLRRILEFVGLIAYCDFDEQVHVGTDEGAYRPMNQSTASLAGHCSRGNRG
jgi:hypothetical protein